jgi:hypothetical protein
MLAEGSEMGRGPRVSTRMRRRAGAHPGRVVGDGGIRKNRSMCMLIVPQQNLSISEGKEVPLSGRLIDTANIQGKNLYPRP